MTIERFFVETTNGTAQMANEEHHLETEGVLVGGFWENASISNMLGRLILDSFSCRKKHPLIRYYGNHSEKVS